MTYFFSLYVDLRQFDKAVLKDVDAEVLLDKAKEIYQDYLEPSGGFHVAVRPDIVAATASKIKMLETTIMNTPNGMRTSSGAAPNDKFKTRSSGFQKELIFIELLSYVLEKLKVLFEKFKRSPMFLELEDEISRQEKLYEILVDASIITQ